MIVETIRRNGKAYNAATGEFGDLIAQGIVDPAKVTRSAVQNAASIAGMVLTTECLVVEKAEPKCSAPAGGGGGGGMGGMGGGMGGMGERHELPGRPPPAFGHLPLTRGGNGPGPDR